MPVEGQRKGLPGDKAGRGWLAWFWGALAAILLVAIGLGLHLPELSPTPVVDDSAVFNENPGVRFGGGGWLTVPFYTGTYRPIWRPLTTLSFRLNWKIWPGGRKEAALINVLLLLLIGLLCLRMLRRLDLGIVISAAAVSILLIHPVVAASILRLAGRSELLSHLFLLAAFLMYVSWVRKGPARCAARAIGQWVLWGVLFLLALLAKESALVLPFLIIGYELTGEFAHWGLSQEGAGRRGAGEAAAMAGRPRRLLALLIVSLVVVSSWAAFRAGVQQGWPYEIKGNPAPDYVAALTGKERVALALSLPSLYGEMIICPEMILPNYAHIIAWPEDAPAIELGKPASFGVGTLGPLREAVGITILAAAFALFAVCRRRARMVALGGWWVGVTLLAVLPLLGTNGHVASPRDLLLPLLGLLIVIAGSLERLAQAARGRRSALLPASALGVLLLVFLWVCAGKTRESAHAWSSQASLMNLLAQAAPLSPEVPLYYGQLAIRKGDLDHAAARMEESIGLFPRNPRALLNLGLLRAEQGRLSVAVRALSDAAFVASQVMPGSRVESQAHMTLGILRVEQDLPEAALQEFHMALIADSTNVHALARAGLMECKSYETAREGIRRMDRAIALDREGSLGVLTQHIREEKDRAQRYLRILEGDEEAYNEAMAPPDASEDQGEGAQRPE